MDYDAYKESTELVSGLEKVLDKAKTIAHLAREAGHHRHARDMEIAMALTCVGYLLAETVLDTSNPDMWVQVSRALERLQMQATLNWSAAVSAKQGERREPKQMKLVE